MQSCHQDGGSSFQYDSGQLHDQVCCQAPHLRGACPALANEGGSKLLKEERNLGKEGLEDEEERDSRSFLMFSAFTFPFSAM